MSLKVLCAVVLCVLAAARDARAADYARFLHPVDGAILPASPAFQWTAVAGATAYVLWVGSTPGGSDLLATGEVPSLSYPTLPVPEGVAVFARVWTRLGNVWRYADVRFAVVTSPPAVLHNAATGSLRVQLEIGLDTSSNDAGWTPDAEVLLADLTGDGLADVFRYDAATGAWQRRVNLGDGRFRVSDGTWPSGGQPRALDLDGDGRDDIFLYDRTTGAWQACFSEPADQFACVTGLWAPGWQVHAAEFNGDHRGDLFLFNGEPITDPNSGRWFKVLSFGRGAFHYVDGSPRWAPYWQVVPGEFDGDGRTDLFLYYRETGRWFVCLNAGSGFTYREGAFEPDWQLHPGDYDGDGRTDLFLYQPSSGRWRQALTDQLGTFRSFEGLWGRGWMVTTGHLDGDARTDLLLYAPDTGRWARVLARAAGTFEYSYGMWEPGYTTVVTGEAVALSRRSAVPTSAAGGLVDAGRPFEWTAPPLARAYRLQVGTTKGAANLHDSGRIGVTRRFVRGLPQGTVLHGRLSTETAGVWHAFDFTFVVGAGPTAPGEDAQIEAALDLAAHVRAMAGPTNAPHGWTPLFDYTTGTFGHWGASCSDYAVVLRRQLAEVGVTLSHQIIHVAFNLNAYDVHTLVEMRDPRVNRWLLIDPTFAMTVRRTSDGSLATARDVSDAARGMRWSDLEFVPLGPDGLGHARNYYIDYPLLFLNVLQGSGVTSGPVSILPFVEPVALSITSPGLYLLQSPVTPRTVVLGGVPQVMPFGGVDGVTWIFWASSIQAAGATEPPLAAYTPRRFVF